MDEHANEQVPKLTPAMRAILRAVVAASGTEATSHKIALAAHVTHGTAGNYLAKLTRAGLVESRTTSRTGKNHGRFNLYRATELGARRDAEPGAAQ